MKSRLLLAAACLIAGLAAAPDAPPEFIRVEELETVVRLQTALTRYTKGDASVELVGAIHIADKAYYEALGKRFEGYDALLYEGIGEATPAVAQAPVGKGKFDDLHAAYGAGAEWLGLSYQMEEIDYRKPNFVHADLSFAEFSALQAERGNRCLASCSRPGSRSRTSR